MVYRPISEYGVIGNDDRIALVDSDGSIDWCCFPSVADRSVFARLLDAEIGGHFAVRPTQSYESKQTYLDTTNVLQTRFETDSGSALLTDFMPIASQDRPATHQQAIFRKLHCAEGSLSVEAEFSPQFDYARAQTAVRHSEHGIVATGEPASQRGRQHIDECDSLHLQVAGPLDLTPREDRAVGSTLLEAGDTVWFVTQYDQCRPIAPDTCQRIKRETVEYWRQWGKGVTETVESLVGAQDWQEALVRSALVLKLLIHEQTGAIYAAPTTSLPESFGGTRNWDYRYNWIRDAKFTVQALYNLGETAEATEYFEWFRSVSHEDPEDIQPVYGVHGERALTEQTLDHLSGHRYAQPVRIGNAATEQRQLDAHGTIVQGLYEMLCQDEHLDEEDWDGIRSLVDHVCRAWTDRGAGIWEYRDQARHYVHSKLLCWVAVDRGITLAEKHDAEIDTTQWEEQRSAIREAIETHGYSDSAGSFVQHFETEETLDAAALLIPIYEFLPPADPRVEHTIETVMDELMTDEGLVHRTTGADVPDEGRGTFLFCTFWLVDALVLADRLDEAREIFETVLEYVDPPHLLPERIDPTTGEFLGNYPQAFSHIGLVNSAIYLCSGLDAGELAHDPRAETDVTPLFRS